MMPCYHEISSSFEIIIPKEIALPEPLNLMNLHNYNPYLILSQLRKSRYKNISDEKKN
ncbi:MAG: hypothetical protein AABZ37_05165 [Thermoproteota archaeon]